MGRRRPRGRCRLLHPYFVPDADDAAADDVGAEAAAVDQPLLHLLVGQAGQVVAGLVEAQAAQDDLAGAELAAHQVVQRHAAGDDVAAGLPRLDLQLVVPLQRLDRLKLDQRYLAARPRRLGVGAVAAEVAVARKAPPGDGADLLDGDGRLAGDRGDVYGVDGAVGHLGRAFLAAAVCLNRGLKPAAPWRPKGRRYIVLLDRQHPLQGDAGVAAGLFVELHLVDDTPCGQLLKRPAEVCRVDAVHGGAGADHRVQAEHQLVRVLAGQAGDEVDLRAHGELRAGRRLRDRLRDELRGAVHVRRLHDLHPALRVDDDGDAGVLPSRLFHLLYAEAQVDGAVALPEDGAGALKLLQGVAAQGAVGEGVVPDRHLVQADAALEAGVPAQVLVGEEENASAVLEGPVVDLGRVGGGADDAAVTAAERLQGGGGVHVGHRYDVRDSHFGQLVPAGVDVLRVRHVGHGAAGRHVGEDDLLVRLREDVRRFGHEVDAAEDDELGLWALGGQ